MALVLMILMVRRSKKRLFSFSASKAIAGWRGGTWLDDRMHDLDDLDKDNDDEDDDEEEEEELKKDYSAFQPPEP